MWPVIDRQLRPYKRPYVGTIADVRLFRLFAESFCAIHEFDQVTLLEELVLSLVHNLLQLSVDQLQLAVRFLQHFKQPGHS